MTAIDSEAGLSISTQSLESYTIEDERKGLRLQVETIEKKDHRILSVTFSLRQPLRFALHFDIPADCCNACIKLNEQMLLPWLAKDPIPETAAGGQSACQTGPDAMTTLRPGQTQTINFRWHDQDVLQVFLVD